MFIKLNRTVLILKDSQTNFLKSPQKVHLLSELAPHEVMKSAFALIKDTIKNSHEFRNAMQLCAQKFCSSLKQGQKKSQNNLCAALERDAEV